MNREDWTWHEIPADEIPDGDNRVRTAVVDGRAVAVTRCGGRVGALDNRCPHQGGPLGEGSIENGWLRCPWHGYDYDPLTGQPPGGFSDAPDSYEVEDREGTVRVLLPPADQDVRTVSDVVVETLVAWGVDTVFGMVGHSNLGLADALRRAEARGELRYVGIRHEGAAAFAASAYGKLTGRPAACLAIAGPGSTNLLTGLYDAKLDGAPVVALSGQVPSPSLGRGAFQDLDLGAVFRDVSVSTTRLGAGSDHAELAGGHREARRRPSRGRASGPSRRGAEPAKRGTGLGADRPQRCRRWPGRPGRRRGRSGTAVSSRAPGSDRGRGCSGCPP